MARRAKIKIKSIAIRRVELLYPKHLGAKILDATLRSIDAAPFYQGIVTGPARALNKKSPVDHTRQVFLISEECADALIADIKSITD